GLRDKDTARLRECVLAASRSLPGEARRPFLEKRVQSFRRVPCRDDLEHGLPLELEALSERTSPAPVHAALQESDRSRRLRRQLTRKRAGVSGECLGSQYALNEAERQRFLGREAPARDHHLERAR